MSDDANQVRRSLKLSVGEGCLHAVMVGVSESYLGALAVQLGHEDLALALLVTLPLLVGSFAQLGASALVRLLGSRRRVAVLLAAVQALVHVGLLCIALFEVRSFAALLAVKTLYWASGNAIGPAWNAWMASLTKDVDRAKYFAWRSGMVQLSLLVAYGAAGFVLESGRRADELLPAFAALHVVAMIARLASVTALWKQADPRGDEEDQSASVVDRLLLALRHARWRIAIFQGVFYFGACIAIPFFTPFMLKTLALDFVDFMALTAVATLVKAVSFPAWSAVAARTGMRPLLFATTLGIALVALLWAQATSMPALLAIQAFSGLCWAGFEFVGFQLLMKSSRDEHRVAFFALATAFSSFMQVLGSVCGSLLLWLLPWGYEVTFVASGFGRGLACLLLLSPMVALLSRGPLPKVFFRIMSVRPEGGSVRAPIVPAATAPAPAVRE